GANDGVLNLPFAWNGVSLQASGAAALRVRLTLGDDSMHIEVADETGGPVAEVRSLSVRPVNPGQLGGSAADSLFTVDWMPADISTPAGDPGDWVVVEHRSERELRV